MEGDVAVAVFDLPITKAEKEVFRKRKSVWSNVNGKVANFVLFFNFKRTSQSFTRELLLDYTAYFIKHPLLPFYFESSFRIG